MNLLRARFMLLPPVLLSVCVASTMAATAEADSKDINNYLVDIAGGTVSAAGLVGAKSGITTIETSQDLVVALQPFTSADQQKSAFGLAITPARTTLLPMSGKTYVSSPFWRLLGNLTFSYAQNQPSYGGATYKATAYAVNTMHYFNVEDDPAYAASAAFKSCADKDGEAHARKVAELFVQRPGIGEAAFKKALDELMSGRATSLIPCTDDAVAALAKARWNSARMSVSYGEGRLGGGSGGSYSLGRSANLNAQYPHGEKGALTISLRRTSAALDTATLGLASQIYKSSSLAAARYTYGDQADTALRALIEVSNAKADSGASDSNTFKYAVGFDKKLMKGTWLEFRLGRNHSLVDGKGQTAALMAFNISPSLFELRK